MLMRIFSLLGTVYPHRFGPQLSMRTFPLFSSVAHTPSGVVGARAGAAAMGAGVVAVDATDGAGAGAGAGAATAISSLAAGAGGATATGVDGVLLASGTDGCGTPASATGAAGAGGSVRCATSSSWLDFIFLKPKPEPERLGAETWMQDSESQFFGASMRILCPSISKEIELPACAAVVAISNAAAMNNFFMRASLGGAVNSA